MHEPWVRLMLMDKVHMTSWVPMVNLLQGTLAVPTSHICYSLLVDPIGQLHLLFLDT